MKPRKAPAPVAPLLVLALLVGAAAPAFALTPLPPRDTRSVYDEAHVIRAEDVRQMESWHRALFDSTGVAIVVVTVPRLEDETIEEFANRVGTEWGVGKKGDDRGIVIALSLDPRKVRVETGYGVEGYLPDGKVGAIMDSEVIPHLRKDDFSRGLLQASAAFTSIAAQQSNLTIEGLQEKRNQGRTVGRGGGGFFGLLFLIFLFLFVLSLVRSPLLTALILSGAGRRRRGPGGWGGGWGGGGFRGGGFGGGGFDGGFGGFGGGSFGGGGASRGF